MQENNNNFNLSQNAKNQITQRFSQINSWSTTNNIPVYLGEFGADNENGIKAAIESGAHLLKIGVPDDLTYESIKSKIAELESN